MINYMILKQNRPVFAHLFEYNLIDILMRGISCCQLFESEIFNMAFSYVEWPALSECDDKVFEPYD